MEKVNLKKCKIPKDYHCNCIFCKKFGGLLIREDGTKYSKLERRKYYSPAEIAHIAKTPLHLARWAIQTYSKPNFVLGVKDMMRNKKPYLLHNLFGEILNKFFKFEQMVLLPHYPPTLFMNTYQKRWPEVKLIPRYQTILVFRKK